MTLGNGPVFYEVQTKVTEKEQNETDSVYLFFWLLGGIGFLGMLYAWAAPRVISWFDAQLLWLHDTYTAVINWLPF